MALSLDELSLPDELPVIPEGWRYESLGDLVEERGVSYGIVQPGSETTDGVPIVRVNNIRNGRIDTSDMLKVGADIEAKFQRSRLRGGEVLLTLVGTLGEVAIVPDNLRGWNVARAVGVIPVRKDPGSLWVSICLRSAFIQHCIRTWATTTVQATFNLRDLAKLPIPIPPTETREAIAAVLGALDDKIELNRRMKATLEAMARTLFQSWFVDFDPVRAKLDGRPPVALDPSIADLFPSSFQDSSIGHIPTGWEIAELGQIADVIDCLHAKKPERCANGQLYLQLNNIRDDGLIDIADSFFVSAEDYQKWISRMEARPGDCVITNVGRVGAVGQIPEGVKAALGRNITGIRCTSAFPFPTFLIECLVSESMREEIRLKTDSGTILDALNVKSIPKLRFVRPTREIGDRFESLARPLRRRMEQNLSESRTLANLRDTLLPKFLSGELSVEKLMN
jgi:type I restriction enzyme S subunit